MVENFSWVENKKDNFKEYALNLPDGMLEKLPSPNTRSTASLFLVTTLYMSLTSEFKLL